MLNKPRKPWISAVLTIVSIGLGHIYTGEAKRGILLFFIAQAVYLLSGFSLLLPVIPENILAAVFISLLFLSYCIIDAVKLSEKFRLSYDMKPCNKWYLYLLFFLITSFAVHPAVSSAIKGNIVQAYKIPSGAMKPSVLIGDHIIADKFIYKRSEVKRGDIIVFPFPEDPSKDFIKRVVGLGDDTVEIRDKQVFINGSEYKEIYKIHADSRMIPKHIQPRDNFGPVTIPSDSLFVMGDNRDHSYDSRFWGFVKKSAVKGKATGIYWSWNKEDIESINVRWNRIGKKIQ